MQLIVWTGGVIMVCPTPEKLFSRERAVQQLLGIIDRTGMRESGKFYAWDGQEIVW